jgi:uncharacterized peroxidase-related enzyme
VSEFKLHTIQSAPVGSRPALERLSKEVGFLPNLAATMAESPTMIEAFVATRSAWRSGTLSALEREVVALVTAFDAGCAYCMAAHSTFAKRAGASDAVLDALRAGELPTDRKLAALATYARQVVRGRGQIAIEEMREFARAGFTHAQALEVFAGVAMTRLSSQAYYLAGPPIDDAFSAQAWDLQPAR